MSIFLLFRTWGCVKCHQTMCSCLHKNSIYTTWQNVVTNYSIRAPNFTRIPVSEINLSTILDYYQRRDWQNKEIILDNRVTTVSKSAITLRGCFEKMNMWFRMAVTWYSLEIFILLCSGGSDKWREREGCVSRNTISLLSEGLNALKRLL